MSNPELDIQSVYGIECRAKRRSHCSMFNMNIFECRAECRTHSSIFQMDAFECRAECRSHNSSLEVYMVLNVELNSDLRARYSYILSIIS